MVIGTSAVVMNGLGAKVEQATLRYVLAAKAHYGTHLLRLLL